MKRALIIAGFLALLASAVVARGRSNVVRHYYDDGSYKEFLASQGSCRHHLSAHPLDLVAKPSGWEHDPAACN